LKTDSICKGVLTHHRLLSKKHAFSTNLLMVYMRISILENADKAPHWPSKKFNLVGYRRKDYFINEEGSLGTSIMEYLSKYGVSKPIGDIYLLTSLSFFGYCFNPISIYIAYEESNQDIIAIILEVTNTPWHERKLYVIQPIQESSEVYTAEFPKKLHVSPFMGMDYDYKIKLEDSKQNIKVSLQNIRKNKIEFSARLNLKKSPYSKKTFFIQSLLHSFLPQRVTFLIYWHAFRLYLKGIPFIPHPKTNRY